MRKRVARWLLGLFGVAVLATVLLTCLAPAQVLPPVARYLDVSQPPRPVDYVLVLNGDPETRPFAAAALVKAGLAREVLLTRQQLTLESGSVQQGAMLSELAITQRILRQRGIPDDAVRVLPGEIGNTGDEARRLAEFLDTQPQATVAVVTNAFHTRRARLIFTQALGGRAAQVYFVGVPRDGVEEATWWQTPHGCTVYLSEYAKLTYYGLRN